MTLSINSGALTKLHGYRIRSFDIVKYDNAGLVALVSSHHLYMTWLGLMFSLVLEIRELFG